MAFKKRIEKKHSQDASLLYIYDATLDYVIDDNFGWGQGASPINRSDYFLLNFVKHIDHAGVETYLEHQNQYPSVNDKSHGLADGNGLANTDQSEFQVATPKDGHHIIYMLHLEKDTTRVSGTLGDVYYNTSASRAEYYDGSQFVEITSSILPSLEDLSVTLVCEYLFDIRITRWLNSKEFEAYEPKKQRDHNLIARIRNIKNLVTTAFANFTVSKPTSRFLINRITTMING